MVKTIEEIWKETQELELPIDMSPRFWVFRAFYGILTEEEKDLYVKNIQDIKRRESEFKRVWLQHANPAADAQHIIYHYSAILGYYPELANNREEIANAFAIGSRRYAIRTRPERERTEALKRAIERKANSD